MHKKNTGNSRLFFIEFLIVLFFFLIISTICLKLFVQAHQITADSEKLSRAQILAASAAELLLSGYEADEACSVCQKQADAYSSEQEPTAANSLASNALCIQITDTSDSKTEADPSCREYLIHICQTDGELIYQLPLTVHHPLTQTEVLL